MSKKVFRNLIFIAIVLAIVSFCFYDLASVLAADDNSVAGGLDTVAGGAGLVKADLKVTIGKILKVILGFLGVIALALILYGGFLYMTSGGEQEKVSTAKKYITNALIGLVLVLLSYSIVSFVMSRILAALDDANYTYACEDGKDNDGDSLVDLSDPGCRGSAKYYTEFYDGSDSSFNVLYTTNFSPLVPSTIINVHPRISFNEAISESTVNLSNIQIMAGPGTIEKTSILKPIKVTEHLGKGAEILEQISADDDILTSDWVVCAAETDPPAYLGGTPMLLEYNMSTLGVDKSGKLKFESTKLGDGSKVDISCGKTETDLIKMKEVWLPEDGVNEVVINSACLGGDKMFIKWERNGTQCLKFDYIQLEIVEEVPNVVTGTFLFKSNHKLVEFVPAGVCDPLDPTRYALQKDTEYTVTLKDQANASDEVGLKSADGDFLSCSSGACTFKFTTGDVCDITAPTVNFNGLNKNICQFPVDAEADRFIPFGAEDDAGVSVVSLYLDYKDDGTDEPLDSATPTETMDPKNFISSIPWAVNSTSLDGKNYAEHNLLLWADDVDGNHGTKDMDIILRPDFCCDEDGEMLLCTDPAYNPICGACEGGTCKEDGDCNGGYCEDGVCVSNPIISNVNPKEGGDGNFVTIYGSGFADYKEGVSQVFFTGEEGTMTLPAETPCDPADAWKKNQIIIAVPKGVKTGPMKVVIDKIDPATGTNRFDDTTNDDGWEGDFVENLNLQYPGLCSASPAEGSPGALVTLAGEKFGTSPTANDNVYFGSASAAYSSWSDTTITDARVPQISKGIYSLMVGKGERCQKPKADCKVGEESCLVNCTKQVCTKADGSTCTPPADDCGCVKDKACECYNVMSNPLSFKLTDPGSFPTITEITPKIYAKVKEITVADDTVPGATCTVAVPKVCSKTENQTTTETCEEMEEGVGGCTCTVDIPKVCTKSVTTEVSSPCAEDPLDIDCECTAAKLQVCSRLEITECAATDTTCEYGGTAPVKQIISITGTNFGYKMGQVIFIPTQSDDKGGLMAKQEGNGEAPSFIGLLACGADSWSDGEVKVKVPETLPDGTTPMAAGNYWVKIVTNQSLPSNKKEFLVNTLAPGPGICSITPNNGPMNTAVTVVGENFVAIPAYVLSFDKKEVDENPATDNRVDVTNSGATWVPEKVSNAKVPADAMTGGVMVHSVDRSIESNSVNFKVGICNDTSCLADQFCCSDGVCKAAAGQTKQAVCATTVQSHDSEYAWVMSTGIIPKIPAVIERTCLVPETGVGYTQSPSPAKGEKLACPNGLISATFNMTLNPTALDGKITLRKCKTAECNLTTFVASEWDSITFSTINPLDIWPQPESATSSNILTSFSLYDTLIGYSGIIPFLQQGTNTNLLPSTWYQVEILGGTSGVASPSGKTMVNSYIWSFKTKEANCEPDKFLMTPSKGIIKSIQQVQKYLVSGMSGCQQINVEEKPWAWTVPATEDRAENKGYACKTGTALYCTTTPRRNDIGVYAVNDSKLENCIKRDLSACADQFEDGCECRILGDLETTAGAPIIIAADALVDKATVVYHKTGELEINFTEPRVTSFYPNCKEACINAQIGVSFNTKMKTPVKTDIKIYVCETEECTVVEASTAVIQQVTYIYNPQTATSAGDNILKIDLTPNTNLLHNKYHRIVVSSALQSISGVHLTGLNYKDNGSATENSFSWVFKTKNDPAQCVIDTVNVAPNRYEATKPGEAISYAVEPKSEPDKCNVDGQKLNPLNYNWAWSASDDDATSTVNDGIPLAVLTHNVYNSEATVENKCDAKCLQKGSTTYRAVCGDGRVDVGEECEYSCVISGTSTACTLPAPSCVCTAVASCNATTCLLNDFSACTTSELLNASANCCGNGKVNGQEQCDFGCDFNAKEGACDGQTNNYKAVSVDEPVMNHGVQILAQIKENDGVGGAGTRPWLVCDYTNDDSTTTFGGSPMTVQYDLKNNDLDYNDIASAKLIFKNMASGGDDRMKITCGSDNPEQYTISANWAVPEGENQIDLPKECFSKSNTLNIKWSRLGGNCINFDYMWVQATYGCKCIPKSKACTAGCLNTGTATGYVCGNGIKEAGEDADSATNKNNVSGDGVSDKCLNEGASIKYTAGMSICGNHLIEAGEECDSVDPLCNNNCLMTGFPLCANPAVAPCCGNGIVEPYPAGRFAPYEISEDCDKTSCFKEEACPVQTAEMVQCGVPATAGCSLNGSQCFCGEELAPSVKCTGVLATPGCTVQAGLCVCAEANTCGANGKNRVDCSSDKTAAGCVCDFPEGCSTKCKNLGSDIKYGSQCGNGTTEEGEDAACEEVSTACSIDAGTKKCMCGTVESDISKCDQGSPYQKGTINTEKSSINDKVYQVILRLQKDAAPKKTYSLTKQIIAATTEVINGGGVVKTGNTDVTLRVPDSVYKEAVEATCQAGTSLLGEPATGYTVPTNNAQDVCRNIVFVLSTPLTEINSEENCLCAGVLQATMDLCNQPNQGEDCHRESNSMFLFYRAATCGVRGAMANPAEGYLVKNEAVNWFVGTYEKVKEFVRSLLFKVGLADPLLFCKGPDMNAEIKQTSDGIELRATPKELLLANTRYGIVLKNLRNKCNSLITPNPAIIEFTTGAQACRLDNVIVSPADLFVMKSGQSFPYTAYAKSGINEIFPMRGVYNWDWSWESSDTALAQIVNPIDSTADVVTQTKNGQGQIKATATIIEDALGQVCTNISGANCDYGDADCYCSYLQGEEPTTGATYTGIGNIKVFLCDNPWFGDVYNSFNRSIPPEYQYSETGTTHKKLDLKLELTNDGQMMPSYLVEKEFNAGLFYCRDFGKDKDLTDDLPLVGLMSGAFTEVNPNPRFGIYFDRNFDYVKADEDLSFMDLKESMWTISTWVYNDDLPQDRYVRIFYKNLTTDERTVPNQAHVQLGVRSWCTANPTCWSEVVKGNKSAADCTGCNLAGSIKRSVVFEIQYPGQPSIYKGVTDDAGLLNDGFNQIVLRYRSEEATLFINGKRQCDLTDSDCDGVKTLTVETAPLFVWPRQDICKKTTDQSTCIKNSAECNCVGEETDAGSDFSKLFIGGLGKTNVPLVSFGGYIDDFRIFSKAKTPQGIEDEPETDLVAAWDFNSKTTSNHLTGTANCTADYTASCFFANRTVCTHGTQGCVCDNSSQCLEPKSEEKFKHINITDVAKAKGIFYGDNSGWQELNVDTQNQCNNGIDDDNNGLIDAHDYKCTSPTDGWEEPALFAQYFFVRKTDNDYTTTNDNSPDAISLRIYENPEGLPPSLWYARNVPNPATSVPNIKADCLTDGFGEFCYAGIQDGRTLYVSGSNINGSDVWNNIYLLSYSQSANPATQNIFGQLVQFLKFNMNKLDDSSISKIKVIRDTQRLQDFVLMQNNIAVYKSQNAGKVPQLEAGTLQRHYSYSIWDSWKTTFQQELGMSMPTDPINALYSVAPHPKFLKNGHACTPVEPVDSQCILNPDPSLLIAALDCGTDVFGNPLLCNSRQQCSVPGISCVACDIKYDPKSCYNSSTQNLAGIYSSGSTGYDENYVYSYEANGADPTEYRIKYSYEDTTLNYRYVPKIVAPADGWDTLVVAPPEVIVTPPASSACSDGVDNDHNGKKDYPNDKSCSSAFDNDESDYPYECKNGEDDDGDGRCDFAGCCPDPAYLTEAECRTDWMPPDYSCDDKSYHNNETYPAQCNDGKDNDGDLLIDYCKPDGTNATTCDPVCTSEYDDKERKKVLFTFFVDTSGSMTFATHDPAMVHKELIESIINGVGAVKGVDDIMGSDAYYVLGTSNTTLKQYFPAGQKDHFLQWLNCANGWETCTDPDPAKCKTDYKCNTTKLCSRSHCASDTDCASNSCNPGAFYTTAPTETGYCAAGGSVCGSPYIYDGSANMALRIENVFVESLKVFDEGTTKNGSAVEFDQNVYIVITDADDTDSYVSRSDTIEKANERNIPIHFIYIKSGTLDPVNFNFWYRYHGLCGGEPCQADKDCAACIDSVACTNVCVDHVCANITEDNPNICIDNASHQGVWMQGSTVNLEAQLPALMSKFTTLSAEPAPDPELLSY